VYERNGYKKYLHLNSSTLDTYVMRVFKVLADEDASDGRRDCKVLVNWRNSLAIDATVSGTLVRFTESTIESKSLASSSRVVCCIVRQSMTTGRSHVPLDKHFLLAFPKHNQCINIKLYARADTFRTHSAKLESSTRLRVTL